MPDTNLQYADGADAASARPDRSPLYCFTIDAQTEQAVRDGLEGLITPTMVFQRGDVKRAIATLREAATPWALIVDISGHPQPIAALEDLSTVVEPDMRVMVIGDRADLGFYRQLTRGLGVADYLYKPLTPAMVAENFRPVMAGARGHAQRNRGGRMVTITGARGGVGASTIAVNLGWHLAHVAQRHTLILDTDLHRGTVPLLLNVDSGSGLGTALQYPERVDDLFIERSAIISSERLHVLASEEVLGQDIDYQEGAGNRLVAALRRRYSLIVADVPFAQNTVSREMLAAAQQRVVVMEPTLAGIRDALRLIQLPTGEQHAHRTLLVVNRYDRRGALPLAQITDTMRMKPDVLLPDLPKPVESSASMGEPAARANRAYAKAIAQLALASAAVTPPAATPKAKAGFFTRWRR